MPSSNASSSRAGGHSAAALALALLCLGVSAPPAAREEAFRQNNLGVALLEQVKFAEAAEAFRRALQSDPGLAIAQTNLAIALFNVPDMAAAEAEVERALVLSPQLPQAHYVRGLIAKATNHTEEALAAFRSVLAIDPDDVGSNINLGQLLMQQQKYAEAVTVLRRATSIESYNSTAAYNLATALLRSGEQEAGQVEMKRFQALRAAGYASSITQNYPLQGRYAEAIVSTGAEPTLVNPQTPAVTFHDATAVMLPGAVTKPDKPPAKADATVGAALIDFDGDGDLDIVGVFRGRARLYHNDKGVFTDVTALGEFVSAGSPRRAAVAGDYDNDGKPDLLILRDVGLRLYHNDGDGKFTDVTADAGIPEYPYRVGAAAFVDIDHDGDLDIFVAGSSSAGKPAPNLLLRNDGQGKFTEVAAEATLAGPSGSVVGVVPTDYDNHRDVDLLLARDGERPLLYRNMREGAFREVAAESGLTPSGHITCVAAGDVNKDSYTDFFFGRADGPGWFAMSDGHEHFRVTAAPSVTTGATAAQFVDYDNDGVLDLVFLTARGLRVVRNLGDRWVDVSRAAVAPDLFTLPPSASPAGDFVSGDLDDDGDTDLVIPTAAGLRIARNDGGEKQASFKLGLTGKNSNRSGVGAKVEVRAGSLRSKLELYAAVPAPAPADLVFGLGRRTGVDAVRILWPSGTLQAETDLAASPAASPKAPRRVTARMIEELDRTPSSCPFLYAWNGDRFAFVTDFMGGGEMGDWLAPGVRNQPDPDEYVRIRTDQLKQRDGRYELRIANELEEALYMDRLELLVLSHPKDVLLFPDEGMTPEPRPFKLYAARDPRPPVAAVDDHGHDVRDQIRSLDGRAVDDFAPTVFRGYAQDHALTLDLGPVGERPLLLLTGWTEYAFSSDNVAASQAGLIMEAPALEVRDASGQWKRVMTDLPFPVGRPQTVVVDLAGKLPPGGHEVRLVTNMRIFWDQIAVADSGGDFRSPIEHLPPQTADLTWRGFSAEVRRAGATVIDYDYQRVSTTVPWKLMPGTYTRLGDVRPLLTEVDDRFVVSQPGDALAVSFDARGLAALPPGWTHTFLLYVVGYSKEMNIHSASPDIVPPIPYRGMKEYPYPLSLTPPRDESYEDYLTTYQTRHVLRPMPLLETLLLPEGPRP